MTAEQRLFLRCLADVCAGRETPAPEEKIDLEEFFRISEEQSLAGIVYIQGRRWLFGNKGFNNAFLSDVFLSVNRRDIINEITERFVAEGIPLIFMKGAVYRDYYPVPELRSMGDVDFIIRHDDRERADRILMKDMGFGRMIDHQAVWTYQFGEIIFEVHDRMFYEHLTGAFDYGAYFDAVWDNKKKGSVFGVKADNLYIPTANFHFLYLMTHTAKHVINLGMGFRAFLDMVFMVRSCGEELVWEWLEKELEKMGLLTFTKTCFALCQRWFDVQMPLDSGTLDEAFYLQTTEKVFEDGIFGIDNEANEGAGSAKEIKRSSLPYWLSALWLTVKKLFPPYEDMQLIPWYSFVDGRPWLLPAAWVYRWGYVLVHKRETGRKKLAEPFLKKELIEKREELIQSWGL